MNRANSANRAIPANLQAMDKEALLQLWRDEKNMERRNMIIRAMQDRRIFPFPDGDDLDNGRLYPDTEDPKFVSRLLRKTEFADTQSYPLDLSANPCSSVDFEVTPVQKFVGNFLHPRTPYMSALLYHGVGVGKTCAAIQAAEAYLDVFTKTQIMIVAPPTIQEGFYRTIFDSEKLVIGEGNNPNTIVGCTSDTYLRLTSTLMIRDKAVILRRVKKAIGRRYSFMGYVQFRNYIRKISSSVAFFGEESEIIQRQSEALRKEFSYRMLIIDEAHNLRDVPTTSALINTATTLLEDEDIDTTDTDEAKGGKLLTPFLKRLLESTEGLKLLLMTATPMFNSVREIVYILNLLLMNDKKQTIQERDILDGNGDLVAGAVSLLQPIANAYISFMRGENPVSFPLRLQPLPEFYNRITVDNYPTHELSTNEIIPVSQDEKLRMAALPLVGSPCRGLSLRIIREYMNLIIGKNGLGLNVRDTLVQAGNCVFPNVKARRPKRVKGSNEDSSNEDSNNSNSNDSNNSNSSEESDGSNNETNEEQEEMDISNFIGSKGFDTCFQRESGGRVRTRNKDASWLSMDNDTFANYSPKCATILKSLKQAEGVCFVYSRFVQVGAFLMALALEANGYTSWAKEGGFLIDGIQSAGGRQCALCPNREKDHHPQDGHTFVPAKYILLTGDKDISPDNKASIDAVRSNANKDGAIIKVVLGSTITAEGLDLRFIRENHILDAWFHLNKTEQIIGRAIRYCSHSLLAKEKRNTTIFLHVITMDSDEESSDTKESTDLYSYRLALRKAVRIGEVSRKLKQYAVDCNLRKNATVFKGLPTTLQIDSQRYVREQQVIDDMDFSPLCDWMECSYQCEPRDFTIELPISDDSTYDNFSARFRETKIKKTIENLFHKQPFYDSAQLFQLLATTGAPQIAIDLVLKNIVNNRNFRIRVGAKYGYIIYKNKYFLFQPEVYQDTSIPMAIRVADYPIKRDSYTFEDRKVEPPAPKNEVSQTTSSLWPIISDWISGVVDGTVDPDPRKTPELMVEINTLISDSQKKRDAILERLGILVYVSTIPSVDKNLYKLAVLQYIWDEWLTQEQKVDSLKVIDDKMRMVADESILQKGATLRFLNMNTGTLDYICKGEPCSSLIREKFEKDKTDPLKQTKADKDHAGATITVKKRETMKNGTKQIVRSTVVGSYGFLVPKVGSLVFKTQAAHPVGKKPDRGQECLGASYKYEQIDKFIPLGLILTEFGIDNLGLTKVQLTTVDISESVQIFSNIFNTCTFLNIILRYMDKLRVGEKRWFFRPIESYFSGHLGKIQKVTTTTLQQVRETQEEQAPKKKRGRKPKGVKESASEVAPSNNLNLGELVEEEKPKKLRLFKKATTATASATASTASTAPTVAAGGAGGAPAPGAGGAAPAPGAAGAAPAAASRDALNDLEEELNLNLYTEEPKKTVRIFRKPA